MNIPLIGIIGSMVNQLLSFSQIQRKKSLKDDKCEIYIISLLLSILWFYYYYKNNDNLNLGYITIVIIINIYIICRILIDKHV